MPMDAMGRNAAKAAALLRQLAHGGRLRILCHLTQGERTANELVEISGLSQSATSQHLARLRAARLVEAEKRGQQVFYRLRSPEVQALLSTLYLIYCKS